MRKTTLSGEIIDGMVDALSRFATPNKLPHEVEQKKNVAVFYSKKHVGMVRFQGVDKNDCIWSIDFNFADWKEDPKGYLDRTVKTLIEALEAHRMRRQEDNRVVVTV